MFLYFLYFSLLLTKFTNSLHHTTCSEDQKHFADVCFTPKPLQTFDINWLLESEPTDGWYIGLGNDIFRLHFAEVLKGEPLNLKENFDNPCFRGSLMIGQTGLMANLTGFGNLHGTWDCKYSKDTLGVNICDAISSGPSKYHEKFHSYAVFMDGKNFMINITCFPNGQAGWGIMARTPTLTDEEIKVISEKVKELGFSFENHVTLYRESC